MSDEDQAVDKMAHIIKMVVRGWPIYGVVFGILWGYGDLWVDKKISDAIKTQTLEQPAIVAMTGAIQTNTGTINRVEDEIGRVSEQVEVVEEDTKAILRIMAGE
jgi:hypothetical protein